MYLNGSHIPAGLIVTIHQGTGNRGIMMYLELQSDIFWRRDVLGETICGIILTEEDLIEDGDGAAVADLDF